MEKKIPLSLLKLIDLLHTNEYIFVQTYCIGKECKFVEVQTPVNRKTFIIRIPSKYYMQIRGKTRVFNIRDEVKGGSPQSEYIGMIKGAVIESDLVCISSTKICCFLNNGTAYNYTIGNAPVREEPKIEPDIASELTEKASQLIKKATKVDDIKVELVEPRHQIKDPAEIVFVDTNGDVIEPDSEIEQMMIADLKKRDVAPTEEKIIEVKEEEVVKSDDEETQVSMLNSPPDKITESGIEMGMVYVAIEIGRFFKKVKDFGEDCLMLYNILDDEEVKLRRNRVEEVNRMLDACKNSFVKKMDDIRKQEQLTKEQLTKLSYTLLRVLKFELLVKKYPKRYDTSPEEISSMKRTTYETIGELNIKLLRMKDQCEQLIKEYTSSISEMM